MNGNHSIPTVTNQITRDPELVALLLVLDLLPAPGIK
jgi:hypothetical protein